MSTLQEYAEQNGGYRQACQVCRLPNAVLESVNDNEREGLRIMRGTVVDWIETETKVSVSTDTLRRHARKCLGIKP